MTEPAPEVDVDGVVDAASDVPSADVTIEAAGPAGEVDGTSEVNGSLTELPLGIAIRNYIWRSGIPDQLMDAGYLGYDDEGGYWCQANGGWVMGLDPDGNPYRDVESTGVCLVAYYVADEWAQPSVFRSTQYPRLHLQVWADRSRDGDGDPTGLPDAEDRARVVWRALHPLFHDPANQIHAFDSVRVHSTTQGGTWTIMDVPNGDGVVRSDCVYDLHID